MAATISAVTHVHSVHGIYQIYQVPEILGDSTKLPGPVVLLSTRYFFCDAGKQSNSTYTSVAATYSNAVDYEYCYSTGV